MSVSSSEITRHVRGLDGIRAVSVIGVFAYHLASINAWGQVEPWTAGGFLGVSTFFTLSGYVVVRRLMIEHASASSIGLRHFWTRRTRRLLPASWATLIVTGAIAASVSDYQAMRTHLGETLRAATLGVFNWQQISSGADYAQHFAGTASPFRHFWSLAVEEQSYVVIAVLAFLVLRGPRGQGNFRVAMVVLTVGSAWAMFRFGSYSTRAYMGTDTRFAEISVGALGALSRPWTRKSSFLNSCAWVACVAMVLMWVRTPLESPWLYRGGLIGLAVLAVIICTSLDSQRPPSRLVSILDWAPIAWLGRVSYGVYLIHWPVLLFTRAPHFGDVPDWARGALQIALTLALAAISYRYLEQPIRNVRVLRPPRFLIAVVVVLVTLMASSVTVFEDRPSALETAIADRDHVVDPRTSTGSTSTPSQGRPSLREPRVMIVGDSLGAALGLGMKDLAEQQNDFAVFDRSIVSCGITIGGTTRALGYEHPFRESCAERPQILADAYASFAPNVVIIFGGVADIADRRLVDGGPIVQVGDPEYDARISQTIDGLVREALDHSAIPIVLTMPVINPIYDPGNAMAPPPYDEAEPDRVDQFDALLRSTVAGVPGARLIDLRSWMETQPGGSFDASLRSDGVHLNRNGALLAAKWLLPQIREMLNATAQPR